MGKVILTSHGLNCQLGRTALRKGLKVAIGKEFQSELEFQSIVLFTMKDYGINNLLREVAIRFGFRNENIVVWDEEVLYGSKKLDKLYDWSYVSEGNIFELKQMLRITGGERIILDSVNAGGSYIGASAGAILATTSIVFAQDFDRNSVGVDDFHGLDLLPACLGKTTVVPHYTKREFGRWKRNTPKEQLSKFDYIDYIPNTGYRVFETNRGDLI